jgi:excisionase family DNA binding protein
MTMENPRRWVSVKEACRYGGFGLTKFYELLNEGRIKAYKFGTRTRVDLDTIDALLASLPEIKPKHGGKAKSRPTLVKDGTHNDV